jgi:hypothetical protein
MVPAEKTGDTGNLPQSTYSESLLHNFSAQGKVPPLPTMVQKEGPHILDLPASQLDILHLETKQYT